MSKSLEPISAKFVTTHFVNEIFHSQHSQLIHRHEDVIELLYVMSGHGNYRVRDKEYFIDPGDLIIYNGGVLHGEDPFMKHKMQTYCCVLKELKIPKLPANTLTDESQSPSLRLSANRSHIENILMALQVYNSQSPMYRNVCEMLANTFLNIIYIEIQEQNSHNSAAEKKNEELISEKVGFNENCHFSSMFKKYVGVTPTQYRDHFKK